MPLVGFRGSMSSRGEGEFLKSSSGPVNTVAPVISGGSVQGDTISVTSNGTWTGTLPITYTYQWYSQETGTIPGATSSSYSSQVSDEGGVVFCEVTATNVSGHSTVDSNDIGPITAAPPPPPSYEISPANVYSGDHWYLDISNSYANSAVTYNQTETDASGGIVGSTTGTPVGSTDINGNLYFVGTAGWVSTGWRDATEFYVAGNPVVGITFLNNGGGSMSIESTSPYTVTFSSTWATSTGTYSGTYEPSGTPFSGSCGSTDSVGNGSGNLSLSFGTDTSANVTVYLDGVTVGGAVCTP